MSLKVRIGIMAGIAAVIGVALNAGRIVYAAGESNKDKVTQEQLNQRLENYVDKDSFNIVRQIVSRSEDKIDRLLIRDFEPTTHTQGSDE